MLLFDECIPAEVCHAVRILEIASTDVRREGLVGAGDKPLVAVAKRLGAIFVTYDLDFTSLPLYAAMAAEGVCVVLIRRPRLADLAHTAEIILRNMRQWPTDCADAPTIISCNLRGCRVRRVAEIPAVSP